MAMKELLHRLQPVQIYIVLALSIAYFLVQLFFSHITHALTLLVDSYHMLCNIVALSGCIMTLKHCNGSTTNSNSQSTISKASDENNFIEVVKNENEAHRHERSLRNTFGWTRIDILTMLIVGIFLAAFCFSLLVEAIQTLIHIDHQDTMHHPMAVFLLGVIGLLLHGICYLLIGGYTYHQGSFLHITSAGDVILDRVITGADGLQRSGRKLSKTKRDQSSNGTPSITSIQMDQVSVATTEKKSKTEQSNRQLQKHTISETMRDLSSTLFVMICSTIVYFADNENVTKFVDPIMSIVSCMILLMLSYPYMKESCLILLQTIPGTIDIELFKADLLKTFNDIVSVHDLHIWQLTSRKYVLTVHILFQNPDVYVDIKDAVVNFFHDQGITIVTIQPEFKIKTNETKFSNSLTQCLIGCQSVECAPKTCCSTNDLDAILSDGGKKKTTKFQKAKSNKKSSSLLSLNVTSLSKVRKLTNSSHDVTMKKSVSESHVGQFCGDDSAESHSTSTNVSHAPSAVDLDIIHKSIEEIKEQECDDQVESNGMQPHHRKESIADGEESGLLQDAKNHRQIHPIAYHTNSDHDADTAVVAVEEHSSNMPNKNQG